MTGDFKEARNLPCRPFIEQVAASVRRVRLGRMAIEGAAEKLLSEDRAPLV